MSLSILSRTFEFWILSCHLITSNFSEFERLRSPLILFERLCLHQSEVISQTLTALNNLSRFAKLPFVSLIRFFHQVSV